WAFAMLLGGLLALSGSAPVQAFKVGIVGYPAIHEAMTAKAIAMIAPAADPTFVANVVSGVYTTDVAHQGDQSFHFDDSTAFNNGFANGFTTIYTMLVLATSEASVCNATTNTCGPNPLFLHPQHSAYRS